MRRGIGRLTYLASGIQPDLAAWAGEFSADDTHFTYRDASATDDPAKSARKRAGKFRYCIENFPRPDALHLVRFADCSFGGEDGGSQNVGLLTLCDSFPGGTFHVLFWPPKVLRRVVRISSGSEAISSIDTSELLQDAMCFCEGACGGSDPVIASTDCKSLFSICERAPGRPRDCSTNRALSLRPCWRTAPVIMPASP